MKKNRIVLSLNYDEIRLIIGALRSYTVLSPEDLNTAHSASWNQARAMMDERVNKLIDKLESKYEE